MEDQELRDKARDLVMAVWKSIDHGSMGANRRKGIYDELASKIRSAALTSSLSEFLESLCRKFEVRSICGQHLLSVDSIMKSDSAPRVLEIIRSEPSLIVVMLRLELESQGKGEGLKKPGYKGGTK